MLSVVKEISIFIVIAQAILYFVPKEAYMKYVKVLIGVMMIAKLVFPVFSFLEGEEWDKVTIEAEMLQEEITGDNNGISGKDAYENLMLHYTQLLEESEQKNEEQNESMRAD